MTEEEIKALQEAKAEAERIASEALAAAEKAKADLSGVVGELTEERRKKNEALEKLKVNNPEPGTPPDVSELVKQELSKAEQARITKEIEDAVSEFKNSKTEFQNDSAGIVFGKFQKELSKFNFSDISSKEQAKARLEEAYRFVKQTSPDTLGDGMHEGTPRTPTSPKDEGGKISPEIEKTLESARITPEKFQKLQGKYAEALESLGFGS